MRGSGPSPTRPRRGHIDLYAVSVDIRPSALDMCLSALDMCTTSLRSVIRSVCPRRLDKPLGRDGLCPINLNWKTSKSHPLHP